MQKKAGETLTHSPFPILWEVEVYQLLDDVNTRSVPLEKLVTSPSGFHFAAASGIARDDGALH